MTGSGKTGLSLVLVEEALRSKVPVLMIDIKGDLPNLLLAFPEIEGRQFLPWIDTEAAARDGKTPEQVADQLAQDFKKGLATSGFDATDVRALAEQIAPRIITPGATVGEPLHVLSSLETRSPLWDEDEEAAHDALSASISLVLRLAGHDGDPRSRPHVVLSAFAERRLRAGQSANLGQLLQDVLEPPVQQIGALAYEEFLPPKEQKSLAQDLNTLLASAKLATWLKGTSLDVGAWLKPKDGRTPAVIVSVAHLDDEERALVLGLLLEEILAYVRGLSGTSELRALIVFDEVFGFLPPHPANPPTKRPLLALLKQARAFGVGVVVATQNPMDIDYKALSNAGVWFVGRLQTDADRERVVEGLVGADGGVGGLDPGELGAIIRNLPKRTFFVRNVHATPSSSLVESRFCMAWMRGPMTRREISRLSKGLLRAPVAEAEQLEPGAKRTEAQTSAATKRAPADALLPTSAEVAMPSAARTKSLESSLASPPPAPEGFRVLHGLPPVGAAHVRYVPFIAANVTLRVRDAKLGLAIERRNSFVAPLGGDGRPDLSRVAIVDPQNLASRPHPAATYDPLPPALGTKKGAQVVERVMRDHALVAFAVMVHTNRELGLFRHDGETPAAFLARCQAAAARRADEGQRLVAAKLAPEIAKLQDKLASAERQLAAARHGFGEAPSGVETVLMGLVARGAASRLERARTKAESTLAKAEEAYRKAQSSLSAAFAEQASEMGAARDEAHRSANAIDTERFVPKKGDAEVQSIAIAWSARAG